MGSSLSLLGIGKRGSRDDEMRTINNIDFTECTVKLHKNVGELDSLIREGRLSDVCEALATIECEAREAGYIINNMVYKREVKA